MQLNQLHRNKSVINPIILDIKYYNKIFAFLLKTQKTLIFDY